MVYTGLDHDDQDRGGEEEERDVGQGPVAEEAIVPARRDWLVMMVDWRDFSRAGGHGSFSSTYQ